MYILVDTPDVKGIADTRTVWQIDEFDSYATVDSFYGLANNYTLEASKISLSLSLELPPLSMYPKIVPREPKLLVSPFKDLPKVLCSRRLEA